MKIIMLSLYIMMGAVLGQSILEPPTNTTGTIGGTAKFKCEVDYGIHVPTMTWLVNKKIIYSYLDNNVDYPLGTNKYVVSNSHTIFTLEVRILTYDDGGNYTCKIIGHDKSAVLIVLGSPVITQETANLMENMTATYTCEARFGGLSIDTISPDHRPEMKLFLDSVVYQATSNIKQEFAIRKVYKIRVDGSMDTKDLKCEIGTTSSKEHLTTSTLLDVQYPARNITYEPQEEKYVFGSNITCSARGNPIPLFEWRSKENEIIKGQTLYITEDMKGKHTWTCTAQNAVGGRMYEVEMIAVFEAVHQKSGKENVDSGSLGFLIAAGFLVAGILGFIAFRRCGDVIKAIKRSNVTKTFYVTTAATVFSSFQHGWNTGVLNIPQTFIKSFITGSFTKNYGFMLSNGQLEMLWAVCVSVYLISGCFGVLVASKMADKIGRKYALLVCQPFGIIAAIFFGFCKMANSLEMLIIGRVIGGFSCGAGSRLVLKYLTEIAPDKIQNEVLVLHQFGITFGILLSQVAGLHHCLGNESWWPILLALSAIPSLASILILPWCPKSPIDYLIELKKPPKEANKQGEKMEKEKENKVKKETKSEVESEAKHLVTDSQHKENSNGEEQNNEEKGPPFKNAKKAFKKFQKDTNFEKYYREFEKKETVTESELFQSEWRGLLPFLILLCGLNICQQLSGINVVFYYSLNVFEASGVPKSMIEYYVVLTGVINVLMTGLSMVGNFQHRQLLFIGMSIMIVSSLLITLALHLQIFYISSVCVITFVMGFALELGSITTYIGRALFIQGPRTPAITIAGTCNWFANFFVALIYPVLHLRAGPNSFLLFTSILLIFIIYFFTQLPETKDKDIKDIYKKREISDKCLLLETKETQTSLVPKGEPQSTDQIADTKC